MLPWKHKTEAVVSPFSLCLPLLLTKQAVKDSNCFCVCKKGSFKGKILKNTSKGNSCRTATKGFTIEVFLWIRNSKNEWPKITFSPDDVKRSDFYFYFGNAFVLKIGHVGPYWERESKAPAIFFSKPFWLIEVGACAISFRLFPELFSSSWKNNDVIVFAHFSKGCSSPPEQDNI